MELRLDLIVFPETRTSIKPERPKNGRTSLDATLDLTASRDSGVFTVDLDAGQDRPSIDPR